ncbi:MAG: c-type cytochrome biogenesis protein CcsB [Deltaproteobacteria bacterium]|nr:MAG: c-type cytochrome biogenesis protein CcsB [Deltaproteobacteria bacterium]
MNSSIILSVITFVYGLAGVLYMISLIFKKEFPGKLASLVTMVAITGNITGIILRWIESYKLGFGHAPLSNLYESLTFFSLTIACLYIFIEIRYKNRTISTFSSALVFLTMAYASLSPDISSHIQPLIPALKSNWLIAHVLTCFLGYAGFAVAFAISFLFLISKIGGQPGEGILSHVPEPDMLDELTHQMVMFGFFFLSIGIITGAVWANSAWGRYWGWDPKETWSLITWFIYAILLHARLMRGWRGSRIAIISIVGFAAVIFTYFGVNYLSGLHSYGSIK